MPAIDLTKEEIRVLIHACQREMDYFHLSIAEYGSGEIRKRNTLMGAYKKFLEVTLIVDEEQVQDDARKS